MVVLMDGQMCVHLLSDEYLAAECGIGKREAGRGCGHCSPGKPWILPSMRMLL